MKKNKAKKDAEDLKSAIKEAVPSQATENDQYFPGPIHIVDALKDRQRFRTIPEIGTDKETIYGFNGQVFVRAEEQIKEAAHPEFIRQWTDMQDNARNSGNRPLFEKLSNCLHRGPTSGEIEEVLSTIRRTTFTTEQMNPPSHIPFKNGLLNLRTKQLEPFSPDLFFTYQVDANLLTDQYITLKETPMFEYLLRTAFYDTDIPMVLSYFAYSFYPGLPAHRVLFILGRERIGKGTSVRVLQGLMPKGSGSMYLARMLTSERFQFTGIEGKNLLIDAEAKRTFRRGTVLDWSAFCNLFGGDTLSLENKGREAKDYVSNAKGIVLGNLPFIQVDSPPATSRILIVETKNERPKRDIKDLDKLILESERDQIATLLMEILFNLIDRDFNFPGQLTDDSTAEILEHLADPIAFFIDDETEYIEGSQTLVEDAYKRFLQWSKTKGITALTRQSFVKRFGRSFTKKYLGPRGRREYFFINCQLTGNDEIENSQDKLQVEHGVVRAESPKIRASGERYRRVQHVYTNLRVAKEGVDEHEDHVHVRVDVHKLNTPNDSSGKPENKPPEEIDPVFNLQEDLNASKSKNEAGTIAKPENNRTHNKMLISKEEGDHVVQSLLAKGIDKNTILHDNNLVESQVATTEKELRPDNTLSTAGKNGVRSQESPMLPHMRENKNEIKEGAWRGTATDIGINQKTSSSKSVATDSERLRLVATQEVKSNSNISINPVNPEVSMLNVHDITSFELNQTQQTQKTILEIANKISQGKPEIKIKPSTILENWLSENKDLIVSLEDLNERILPSMAADGLLTLHNGTISVTGKKLEQINYVLVTIHEDLLDGIAWKDNNYYLHKGDIAHVPEEIADLLIQRQWATRITETNGRDEPVDREGLSITEEEGMKTRDALLSLGIHLKAAETGKSYDGKKFQISFETGYFNQNRDKIESKMKELGFTQSNTGSLGIVFFNRPLKKGDQP